MASPLPTSNRTSDSEAYLIFFATLICSFFIPTSPAHARNVDWTSELAADAILVGATLVVEKQAAKNARYQGDEFPTQKSDDRIALAIHGKPTGTQPTKKERFYREASNISVFSAATLPIGLALLVNENELLAARIMTTAHSLILSNFAVTLLKNSVRRPRPKSRQETNSIAGGDEALSFPSGHSSAAFAGATLVATMFPASSWWIKAGGFTLAGFTAWARIAGDKHFFFDVATGGMIGAGSVVLTESLYSDESSRIGLLLERDSAGLTYRF